MEHPESLDRLRELARDQRVEALRHALGSDAKLHIVGGAVRDALLGEFSGDIDLASALAPQEVMKRLVAGGIKVIPTGLQHQTVTAVPVEGQPQIEITTFRGPQMRPDQPPVLSTTIEEDLQYRDFTVNALAFSLDHLQLIDPFNAQLDLEQHLIRAIQDPRERFNEDPLRVLRMIRIACEKRFEIEDKTFQAAKHFASTLHAISVERVRDEFSKMLVSPEPVRALTLLREAGFLEQIVPELAVTYDFEQNRFHRLDVFLHTLEVVGNTAPDLVLRLAALFHDIGKPPSLSVDEESGDRHFFLHEVIGAKITETVLRRLRYSNEIITNVVTLVRVHMRPLEAGAGGLRRILRDTAEVYPLWRQLKEADALACKVDSETVALKLEKFDAAMEEVKKGPQVSPLSSLAVNGRDIMSLGIPEGRLIGDILRALHEKVLDDPSLNSKETLLELALKMRTS